MNFIGNALDYVIALDPVENDAEFVSSESRDHVTLAQTALNAFGKVFQQQVASLVPHRVVDQLQAIKVEQQQSKRAVLAGGRIEQLVDLLVEQSAIRQAGQGIDVGQFTYIACALRSGQQAVDALAHYREIYRFADVVVGAVPRKHGRLIPRR